MPKLSVNLRKSSDGFVILLVFVVTLLVYANSLGNSFVLDDESVITKNDFIKSWNNFPAIFKKSYLTDEADCSEDRYGYMAKLKGSGELSYRPVVTSTYFLDYSIWKLEPFGYHLTNLLLHIFNSILLYFLASLLLNNNKLALFASLLFALHPANSEAVNCIGSREDLLAFLFFLSAFIFYIKSGLGKKAYYFLSLPLFFLGLFSKETSMMLPIVLICYDYLFTSDSNPKRLAARAVNRYMGYAVVLSFYIWVRFFVFASPSAKYAAVNLWTTLNKMAGSFFLYVKDIVLPFDVNIYMTSKEEMFLNKFSPGIVFFIISMAAIFFIFWKLRKPAKELAFCIAWFFITLFPVSNIYPLYQPVAGRYLYLPLAGFCIFLPVLLMKPEKCGNVLFSKCLAKGAGVKIIVIILIGYFIFTSLGNMVWRDNFTVWQAMLKKKPNSYLAHKSLAIIHLKNGALDEAVNENKYALSSYPDSPTVHNDLGVCYLRKGDTKGAINEFKEAIRLSPLFPAPYYNLGLFYQSQYDLAGAEKMFQKAAEINPDFRDVRRRLDKLRREKR